MNQIADNVYHISVMPRDSINCYWVGGILIDAGIRSSRNVILNNIKRIESETKISTHTHVLTHAHADHQGSTKAICDILGIPLWTSEPEKGPAESGNVTEAYNSQLHPVTLLQKYFWVGEGMRVSNTFKENDRVGDFVVIETPGHSKGHVSFYRESDGVLIVGDACVNMNLLTTAVGLHEPPDLFTLDRMENVRSIKKLAALHPRILCFGHGPVLINGDGRFEAFAESLK